MRSREWLLSVLGAREVSEGANLTVIDAKSKELSRGVSDDPERLLASPLKVYLDLLNDHGRSKEMAEHLSLDSCCARSQRENYCMRVKYCATGIAAYRFGHSQKGNSDHCHE